MSGCECQETEVFQEETAAESVTIPDSFYIDLVAVFKAFDLLGQWAKSHPASAVRLARFLTEASRG